MAFPLVTVLTAAPGIISAASDIIKLIRNKKPDSGKSESELLAEVESLLEKQALVIEELAVNNRQLALAVRNNRLLSLVSLSIAVAAIVITALA